MDLRLLLIVAFLSLALVVTHATLPSEDYWQSVLPNTPMPKAIQDLLPSGSDLTTDKKSTSVNVGNGGVNVNTGTGKSGGTSVNVGKGGVNVNTGTGKSGGGTGVNVGRKGVGVSTGKSGSGTHVAVGKGGVSVHTSPSGKPATVNVSPPGFLYKYAASEDQLRDDPNVALFFQEKDLQPGTTMNLHFTKTTPGATFLPRKEAETIPFSSYKFSDILQRYSVQPKSKEAQVMKNTIHDCEEPAMEGEDKYCATSLESMVDFSTSKLGTTNVEAMSTEVDKEEKQKQKYTITRHVKKMGSDDAVVCHDQPYVYAVFYCHSTHSTRSYKVSLVGADGTKANAVAVCHTDTAKWNPKHLAFQVLKVKPGTVPVCHFLPEDHVVWVRK